MALKTFKKAGEYKVIYSGDDSICDALMAMPMEERRQALQTAWETQNWAPLIKPGSVPVYFVCKPLGSDAYGRWTVLRDEHGNNLIGTYHGNRLLARMALIRIEGDDAMTVNRIEHPKYPSLGALASAEVSFDLLGTEESKAVQNELGEAVYHRETTTLGKA